MYKAVEAAKTDICRTDCYKAADACVNKAAKDSKEADACAADFDKKK